MQQVSIECKISISSKCRVLVQASKLIAVYKNLFVELKMYSEQGQIKKLGSKPKRQV